MGLESKNELIEVGIGSGFISFSFFSEIEQELINSMIIINLLN